MMLMAIGILSLSLSISTAQATMMVIPNIPLWTDTGLNLNNGDIVKISASGNWTWEAGVSAYSGPDGTGGTANNPVWPSTDTFLSSANHGALIAYVGVDPYQGHWGDSSFFPQTSGYWNIGSSAQFTSNQNGKLWLGFNDDTVSEGVCDNAGSVTAQISVNDSSTVPEPCSLLLFGLSFLALRKYRK